MIISLNNYFLSNLKNSNNSKKGNKKLVKAYHLHSFDANSNKYDHLTVSDEGVLHGELESTTGNTVENIINDDDKDTDIATYIESQKKWTDQYGRKKVSRYEVPIGRSLRFLLKQSKGYKVMAQMPIGKRPDADPRGGQMIADIIVEKIHRGKKYRMFVDIMGGYNDKGISIFHPVHDKNDKFKREHYNDELGFDDYVRVKVRDRGKKMDVHREYVKDDDKKASYNMLNYGFLVREINGILINLELSLGVTFTNEQITNACTKAWHELNDYLAERKTAELKVFGC